LSGLVTCQHHKVVDVSHKLEVGPRTRSVATAMLLLEPMEVDGCEER
jgi:hypothetical protein